MAHQLGKTLQDVPQPTKNSSQNQAKSLQDGLQCAKIGTWWLQTGTEHDSEAELATTIKGTIMVKTKVSLWYSKVRYLALKTWKVVNALYILCIGMCLYKIHS